MSADAAPAKDAALESLADAGAQDVEPGYKRTEVGVIPADWDSLTVQEIAASTRNSIVGGPFGSDLISKDYVDRGVPVIRGQNMSGQWVSGSFVFVTPSKAKSLEANLAHPGDLVFTQRGTLGQVSLVPMGAHDSYLVSQSQMKVSLDGEIADPLFFFYVFTSEEQQHLIRNGTIQTGVPHINLGILRDIPVQRPPLREQRAIAEALSDVDGFLGALEAVIAKKRAIKQAAMQQLLTGKTRLPGFSGRWEEAKLGELFQFKNGLNKAKRFFGHGTPIVNYMDVFERPILKASELAGRVRVSRQEIQNFDVRRGDVFFTRTSETPNEIGVVAVMLDEPTDTVFSGFLLRARPTNQRICDDFKAYCLSSGVVRNQIISTASYTTRALTNGKLLSRVSVRLAPPEEQAAIATVLSNMDAEITALERRRDKTRAIKQGMMQQLLTGRVRLVARVSTPRQAIR